MAGSRREFVAGVVAASVAPLFDACARTPPFKDPRTVDVSALTVDGAGVVTDVMGSDGRPILVTRLAPTSFAALSTGCTHEGCPVGAPVQNVITCPCHGSQYDLRGHVLHGPAMYPLTSYPVRYDAASRHLTVDAGA